MHIKYYNLLPPISISFLLLNHSYRA